MTKMTASESSGTLTRKDSGTAPATAGCCAVETQAVCCEPDAKSACCGTATGTSCSCQETTEARR